MMILVVLLLFGILAIAGAIIDMGYVSLARLQMQTATDAASIEGLRTGDCAAARDLVSATFDDPAGQRLVGAGPDPTLTGGVTHLNALQALDPEPFVYKPELDTNPGNTPEGDMVRGAFSYTPLAMEDATYTRNDFDPDTGGPAFLVRMRRSNEENIPGGTSGRAIPFLLARGGTIQANSDGYSPRIDGITVRATSIADARPALRVGLPTPDAPGVTGFALSRDYWIPWPPGPLPAAIVHPDGRITDPLLVQTFGRYVATATDTGSLITPAPLTGGGTTGFVPIYDTISGVERVVGFGTAQLIGLVPGPVTIVKGPATVPPLNATAHLAGPRPALSTTDWALILQLNRALPDALLAPVLVR